MVFIPMGMGGCSGSIYSLIGNTHAGKQAT